MMFPREITKPKRQAVSRLRHPDDEPYDVQIPRPPERNAVVFASGTARVPVMIGERRAAVGHDRVGLAVPRKTGQRLRRR